MKLDVARECGARIGDVDATFVEERRECVSCQRLVAEHRAVHEEAGRATDAQELVEVGILVQTVARHLVHPPEKTAIERAEGSVLIVV